MSVARNIGIGIVAAGAAAVVGYRLVVRPWWRSWGASPEESGRALPGDEILVGGVTAETRAITIDAPPDAVWPWLVQMGFGRAGWYSYDAIDMAGNSSERIIPEHQDLTVGDVMPTHPGGGFVVKRIDPGRALVLYLDAELVKQQADAYSVQLATDDAEGMPPNLKVTGAVMANTQPTEFAATWAFVLDDVGSGRTRLTERFRVAFGETDKPWTRYTLPMMGFGVFVMVRKQLLGIKARAEGASVIEAAPLPETAST
jgi:hypothetical protein